MTEATLSGISVISVAPIPVEADRLAPLEQALRVQPDFADATDARRLLNDLTG